MLGLHDGDPGSAVGFAIGDKVGSDEGVTLGTFEGGVLE